MVRRRSHIRLMVRRGFTITELLVSLALIILIMNVLNQAFVEGLQSFRKLKAIGDMQERLRAAAVDLHDEVLVVNRSTQTFIEESWKSGSVDADEAAELRGKYKQIIADADRLEVDLEALEKKVVNPADQRLVRESLETLQKLKAAAEKMELMLSLLAPDETKP